MLSPPQMAAGLLALIAAGVGTWLTSGHKPLPPVRAEPSPIAMSFAALEKADKLSTVVYETIEPRVVKAIPVPKRGASAGEVLFLSGENPNTEIKTNMTERKEFAVQAKTVWERSGGRKVEFTRHHHETWRCVYPHERHRHHRHRREDD